MSDRRGGNWTVVVGAVGITAILGIVVILLLMGSKKMPALAVEPTSVMVVLAAPTLTPTPTATPYYTPTPTSRPGLPTPSGEIKIGSFVQISGTSGAGLRLRSGPGLNYDSKFLGMDAEVFEVKDGPTEANGIQWWFLVAPYDQNRSGWAASNYLQIVNANQ